MKLIPRLVHVIERKEVIFSASDIEQDLLV